MWLLICPIFSFVFPYSVYSYTWWKKDENLHITRSNCIMTKAVLHLILSFIGLLSLFSLYFIYRMQVPAFAELTINWADWIIAKPDMPEKYQSKPTIAKVMMIYGDKPIYQRALDTHREHSRRFGYPHIVLRTSILDSVWSKPAILLSLLLQELQKPPSERLEWLLWVKYFYCIIVVCNYWPKIDLVGLMPIRCLWTRTYHWRHFYPHLIFRMFT